MSKTPKTLHA